MIVFDTKSGYSLPGSAMLIRQGNYVTVALPDFTDDIAFKLYTNSTGAIVPPSTPAAEPTPITLTSTDPEAGQWVGTVFQIKGDWAAVLRVTVQPGCKVGRVCGISAFDWCSIDLVLNKIERDTLSFVGQKVSSNSNCPPGGTNHLRLQPDGTILLQFDVGWVHREILITAAFCTGRRANHGAISHWPSLGGWPVSMVRECLPPPSGGGKHSPLVGCAWGAFVV